jgi:hypothetical protein
MRAFLPGDAESYIKSYLSECTIWFGSTVPHEVRDLYVTYAMIAALRTMEQKCVTCHFMESELAHCINFSLAERPKSLIAPGEPREVIHDALAELCYMDAVERHGDNWQLKTNATGFVHALTLECYKLITTLERMLVKLPDTERREVKNFRYQIEAVDLLERKNQWTDVAFPHLMNACHELKLMGFVEANDKSEYRLKKNAEACRHWLESRIKMESERAASCCQ